MSCSIHYTCPNNADVTDPAVLVAAATLWEIKQKKREKKLQKLEKEMKIETVTVLGVRAQTAEMKTREVGVNKYSRDIRKRRDRIK